LGEAARYEALTKVDAVDLNPRDHAAVAVAPANRDRFDLVGL
jgi:hypothetical protein